MPERLRAPQRCALPTTAGVLSAPPNPEKVEEIGEYTLKVKDSEEDAVLTSKDVTLKLGASYEFLVQWNDQEGQNNLALQKTEI